MRGVRRPQRCGRRLIALGVLATLGAAGAVSARGVQRDDEVERLIDRAVPSLTAGPAVAAWGVHVVIAWVEGPVAASPVLVMVSRDAGRHFTGPSAHPSLGWTGATPMLTVAIGPSAAPARSAGVPALRVVVGVHGPGEQAAAGGRAIVSADGGRTFARAAVSEVVTTELAAAAWTVAAAPASDVLYHAMPPPNVTRRGPLVIARPADMAAIDPALTFDAHQVVAAVWREAGGGLLVRRYATSWGAGAPFKTRPFDLPVRLPVEGALVHVGVVPAATGICVVTGSRSGAGARIRAVRVPVSLLCAPPARPLS